jgi:hypothetical protein
MDNCAVESWKVWTMMDLYEHLVGFVGNNNIIVIFIK